MATQTKATTLSTIVETKSDKFRRLANARAGTALMAINSLKALNSPAYEYTTDQIDKMEKALTASVSETIKALRAPSSNKAKASAVSIV